MTTAFPHVFSPFRIGGVELRNRIFVPVHTTNYGVDHLPNERHVHYHAEKARGGVGRIIFEAVRVHPSSIGCLWGWGKGGGRLRIGLYVTYDLQLEPLPRGRQKVRATSTRERPWHVRCHRWVEDWSSSPEEAKQRLHTEVFVTRFEAPHG